MLHKHPLKKDLPTMNTAAFPGLILTQPDAPYLASYRQWQGCPSICRTPGGTLYGGWYSGGSREPSYWNYNILARSDDGGINWREPLLVIATVPATRKQLLDIQLWLDPRQRLWCFWVQRDYACKGIADAAHVSTWAIRCDDPDADELRWSAPFQAFPGFLRCQPTALSDGRWLACAYDWTCDRYCYSESSDQGHSWQRRQGGKKLDAFFDETQVLERRDGSLLMFARSCKVGRIAQSCSFDAGASWSDGAPTDIPNPSSRFFLTRLQSGRVLLINNLDDKRRVAMSAMLSEDDGHSWPQQLMLENSTESSYPDAVQAPDGSIHIIYDRGGRTARKEIVNCRINEDDIIAGKIVTLDSFIGNIVSKAPQQSLADPAERERIRDFDNRWLKNQFGDFADAGNIATPRF